MEYFLIKVNLVMFEFCLLEDKKDSTINIHSGHNTEPPEITCAGSMCGTMIYETGNTVSSATRYIETGYKRPVMQRSKCHDGIMTAPVHTICTDV